MDDDDLYYFDELQKTLSKQETIQNAEEHLTKLNIEKEHARLYLSAQLFDQFPNFFENVSNELIDVSKLVVQNIDLPTSLMNYKTMLQDWKHINSINLKEELDEMKQRTRASSSETENIDCQTCYKTQGKILDVAYKYFENISSKTS